MTQTRVFDRVFISLNLLIEPKAIIRPKGNAKSKVIANISNVLPKPISRLCVTVASIFYLPFCNYFTHILLFVCFPKRGYKPTERQKAFAPSVF